MQPFDLGWRRVFNVEVLGRSYHAGPQSVLTHNASANGPRIFSGEYTLRYRGRSYTVHIQYLGDHFAYVIPNALVGSLRNSDLAAEFAKARMALAIENGMTSEETPVIVVYDYDLKKVTGTIYEGQYHPTFSRAYHTLVNEHYTNRELAPDALRNVDGLIIDLGCGLECSLPLGLWDATKESTDPVYSLGFDILPPMHIRQEARPFYRQASMHKTGLPDASVAVAFSTGTYTTFSGPLGLEALREIHRILKPGGFFYFSHPSRSGEFTALRTPLDANQVPGLHVVGVPYEASVQIYTMTIQKDH